MTNLLVVTNLSIFSFPLYNRFKDKEAKAMRNKEIHTANKGWSIWSESKSNESLNSDSEDSEETKSLPASSTKEWHPTVPKPFSFTLRYNIPT